MLHTCNTCCLTTTLPRRDSDTPCQIFPRLWSPKAVAFPYEFTTIRLNRLQSRLRALPCGRRKDMDTPLPQDDWSRTVRVSTSPARTTCPPSGSWAFWPQWTPRIGYSLWSDTDSTPAGRQQSDSGRRPAIGGDLVPHGARRPSQCARPAGQSVPCALVSEGRALTRQRGLRTGPSA